MNIYDSDAEFEVDATQFGGSQFPDFELPDSYFELLEGELGAAWHSMPKRRRLTVKTSPLKTGYPNTALVTRASYKISMARRKVEVATNKRDKSAAMAAALKLLAAQPDLAHSHGEGDENATAKVPERAFGSPDPSHSIQSLSRQFDIIVCRSCAAWSKNDKLKALKLPCRDLNRLVYMNGNTSCPSVVYYKTSHLGLLPVGGQCGPCSCIYI